MATTRVSNKVKQPQCRITGRDMDTDSKQVIRMANKLATPRAAMKDTEADAVMAILEATTMATTVATIAETELLRALKGKHTAAVGQSAIYISGRLPDTTIEAQGSQARVGSRVEGEVAGH